MIQFENISKKFSDRYVLDDFSFSIAEGDKVLITGRSGIGKSTLFRLLLGFEQPDRGVIRFKGKVLDERSVWDLRKEIAYVSQDTVLGQGKVSKLLDDLLSLKVNSHLKINARELLPELLKQFDLEIEILDKDIESLSGGERQRMALVIALMLQRKIFLLDEFTSALDKELKEKVAGFFLGNNDFTVLAISHDAIENKNARILKLEEA